MGTRVHVKANVHEIPLVVVAGLESKGEEKHAHEHEHCARAIGRLQER